MAETAPSAVEGYGYPGAARILEQQHVRLKSGDGNILLIDCSSPGNLLEVFSRALDPGPAKICFRVDSPTGYLALELPSVYSIKGDDHTVRATLHNGSSSSSTEIRKNYYTPVGEGASTDGTTLLELTATDGPQATAGPAATAPAAVAALTVGRPGRPGAHSCTATLVAPQWLLSAAGCFADQPDTPTAVAAGAPRQQSTATVNGRSIEVVELVPRTDRDLVLARLAESVATATPVAVATAAPAAGEELRVLGLGRTGTEWLPKAPHASAVTTGAVAATGLDLTARTPADRVCQGDGGGPVWRVGNGEPAIVGVLSRSWQAGCLGTDATETRTGAYAGRVDDLATWVKVTTSAGPYLLSNTVTGKCADIPDLGPGRIGAPVGQYTCDGTAADNQLFYWDSFGTGSDGLTQYVIRNAKDGLCLDVHDHGAVELGALVSEYTCDGTAADNQLFERVPRPTGGAWIVNVKSGLCLDVDGVRTGGDGARLTLYACSDSDDHTWTTVTAAGPYLFLNTVMGKCADVPDLGPGRIGAPVGLYSCVGTAADNQLFYWEGSGTGQYVIRNAKDGLCLDVHDHGAVELGALVSEYTCDGTAADNQLFERVPRPTGGAWIVNVKSGLCLDADGTRLTLYTCSDDDDHNWQLR
ncbi:hypothetical protein GCM10010505_19400 [Kitasatospora aburaviensis]